MKATLATVGLAVIATGLAVVQFNTSRDLRQQLLMSEAENAELLQRVRVQADTNVELRNTFEQQISSLQQNLQSSSRQLVQLSESLQEARGLMQGRVQESAPATISTGVVPIP